MLTVGEIALARSLLKENAAVLWTGDEGVNDTSVELVRYWPGIADRHLDACLEFLRRFASVKNQAVFGLEVAGPVDPDVSGTYVETGEESHGSAVYAREDGEFEFRVDVSQVTGAYYWQLRRVEDGAVLWISSGGAVQVEDPEDALEVHDLWVYTDEGVFVPLALGDEAASLESVAWMALDGDGAGTDFEFVALSEAAEGLPAITRALSAGTQARSVEDPEVNRGKVRDGIWRAGELRAVRDRDGAYGMKGAWCVLQKLGLELNDSAAYGRGVSRWRIKGEKHFKSGSRNIVLELPWCDPSRVQALAGENTDKVYNSAIYTVNGGLLEGKWYAVDTTYQVDPTGYASVLWFLRNHDNEDFAFTYLANPDERVVEFFKLRMPVDGIADFRDNYWFDWSGNFYVSATGIAYTAKNGESATGTLPADAARLGDAVAGREVTAQHSPEPDSGEVNVRVRIVFASDARYDGGEDGEGGRLPLVVFGWPLERIRLCEQVVSSDLPNGGAPDAGRYEDVYVVDATDAEIAFADVVDLGGGAFEDGDGNAVSRYTGMRLVAVRYENFEVANGKYRYRKLEVEYNAPRQPLSGAGGAGTASKDVSAFAEATEDETGARLYVLLINNGAAGDPIEGDVVYFPTAAKYTGHYVLQNVQPNLRVGSDSYFSALLLDSITGDPVRYAGTDASAWYYSGSGGHGGTATTFGAVVEQSAQARTKVTSTGHGVAAGSVVRISGTANYDGNHAVLHVVDANNFIIAAAFAGTETGTFVPATATAAQLSGWFYHGGGQEPVRESRSFYSGVSWYNQTGNPNSRFLNPITRTPVSGSRSRPYQPDCASADTWRRRSAVVLRKYFVRLPTREDLENAGIDEPGAAASELGPTVQESVLGLSQHLYCLERTVVELTPRQAETADVPAVDLVRLRTGPVL